ncbi:restriction endonuclease PLD domain-containing protein [Mycoplasma wenyonii]|uniref:restriction endonuclease PLD domain-containing protein n=1 Tax=Mycoplasma wenyonii TaxID=65123 RepID=UPI0003027E50|nr:restriction endonuclease PLD domain-containing protein [Mycoplasma wenyonii]
MYKQLLAMEDNTFLVTYISPLFSEKGERTINECFRKEMAKADGVEISVAYCGYNSLKEMDRLVKKGNIKYICLILGMYYFIGLQDTFYKLVMQIHTKWQKKGVGEIRLVDFFKHHDKIYCFYKDGKISSTIIGSPNLSFLIKNNKNRKPRQHELGELIDKPSSLKRHKEYMEKLKSDRFSKNMTFLERYKNVVVKEEVDEKNEIVKKTKITYTKNY